MPCVPWNSNTFYLLWSLTRQLYLMFLYSALEETMNHHSLLPISMLVVIILQPLVIFPHLFSRMKKNPTDYLMIFHTKPFSDSYHSFSASFPLWLYLKVWKWTKYSQDVGKTCLKCKRESPLLFCIALLIAPNTKSVLFFFSFKQTLRTEVMLSMYRVITCIFFHKW